MTDRHPDADLDREVGLLWLGEENSEWMIPCLALARIAYSLGSFDAAIFYYRKVPSDSTNCCACADQSTSG